MAVVSLLDLRLRSGADTAVVTETLLATRAFAGCLGVEVVRDVDDPDHLIAVERWESLEADDAYRAFRATPEGASGLGDILAGPPVLTRSEVTDL